MAKRKTMSLIGDVRARATTFKRRTAGLKRKAEELATLCDVDVAVACAGPDNGGAPEVWESREGVIERYRARPAEERAKHTLLAYAEAELAKERAKLGRVRQAGPGALAPRDAAAALDLDGMSLEEVQAVLGSIDAAIRATAERRKALGLPGDADADDGQLQHAVPLGRGVPCIGGEVEDMNMWVQELMWGDGVPHNAGTMHPVPIGQHIDRDVDTHGNQWPLQMLGNGDSDGHGPSAWDSFEPNAIVYPGCGVQCSDSNFVDMDCYQMAVPGNANADDGWLGLAMWGTDESSCNAVVPVGYPPWTSARTAPILCTRRPSTTPWTWATTSPEHRAATTWRQTATSTGRRAWLVTSSGPTPACISDSSSCTTSAMWRTARASDLEA
ncbi:hypothetical protein ACP70R_036212 [Stipagrostis hirtigluma subsp. patula]